MKSKIGAAQQAATKHPPASAEAKAAQNAAVAPPNDKDAQAKAAKADEMGAAKPGPFDKAGFIAAVNKAIAAQAPKNLDEADKFASSGKADNVKAEVMGKVTKGKEDSVKPLAEKSQQAPDTSKAVDKPVTPLPATKPETKPAPLDAAKAMPPKAPAEQTNLGAPKCETDKQMAEAGVTEGQLAKSNEPQFTEAVAAKKEGEAHSATAPAQVRQSEAQQLNAARAGAQDAGQAGAAAMAGARGRALQQVAGQQGDTKSKDEAKRREVTGPINAIFDKTKTEVTKILGDLDGLVSTKFEEGERQAKAAFTADHQARMQRYKDQRYSGPAGWLRWTGDLFADLPAEANQLFVESRKLYELKMQAVISDIADLVGRELTRAKERVAAGRAEIAKHVAGLSPDLRKVGAEAAKEIGGKFDELDAAVDEKSQSLVADLASKYVEARNAVDDEIKQLQEQNKGLWSKAKDAVGGAIETILKLKDMLLGVLARAAGAIENVIKDPIGFLGKFVNAVKTGITNFASNIVDHLKKGLQGWLLGSLANAGIELPEKFDLKGIVKLVLSMLGLTWSGIRARLTKFIPEPVLLKIEQTVEIFKILVTEGVGGLWKWIVGKLTDLKDMVMGQIRDFVITKIVKAGITWLISLLNPAAAFIKACKMIYDVVMFFVEKADQIKEFVDSVLDSIESIAKGGVGAVAGYIEKTLAKTLPVVLGFLASLLGLGGISEKIKGILKAAQEKVGEAVDWVIKKALKVAAPFIKAFKKGADWVKGKVAAGKAWVKGKYEAGKAWVKKKYEAGKVRAKRALGAEAGPEERQRALDTAMAAGQRTLQEPAVTTQNVRSRLIALKREHKVRELELVVDSTTDTEETVHIVGANSPRRQGTPVTKSRGRGRKIDKAAIAEAITRNFRARVDADIARDVDRAFVEYEGPAKGPAFPKARSAPGSAPKKQARGEFEPKRGESVDEEAGKSGTGYAEALGVERGGQVHHAIELQVLALYPGVFTIDELNALENMRGITPEGVPPAEVEEVAAAARKEMERKKQLHNSKIREVWNHKYNQLDTQLSKQPFKRGSVEYTLYVRMFLVEARNEIDYLYGQFFSEYRRTLEWKLGMLEEDQASLKKGQGS